MKCPNCKTEFFDGNRCPKCKIDAALYRRTVLVSNTLYNEGLKKAKLGDLSASISSLEKSLEFNKANVDARNLLGLVNFEIGRIGDAIKHWVLSTSYLKNENLAAYYLDAVQRNSKLVERLNESVLMFNQALAYLHQDSEDLAIIQLKRALEYNPKFIDALNILSLCYIVQDDKEKAKQTLERVFSVDTGNELALYYYNDVFGKMWNDRDSKNGKASAARADGARFETAKVENVPAAHIKPQFSGISTSDEKNFRNGFHIPEIISFIVGGICAFAVFYILILPAEIEKRELEINGMNTNMQANEQMLNDEIERKNAEIAALTAENAEIRESKESLEEEILMMEKIQRVNRLEAVYNAGVLEDTILLLPGIEPAGMPADVLEKYEFIKNDTYEKYAKQMHDNGVKSFSAKSYEQAREEFEVCLKYAVNTLGITDNALYLLGAMADNEKDYETAKVYYQKVENEFPDSTRIGEVRKRLSALQ